MKAFLSLVFFFLAAAAHAQLAPSSLNPAGPQRPLPPYKPFAPSYPAAPAAPEIRKPEPRPERLVTVRYYEGRVKSVNATGAVIECSFAYHDRNPLGTAQDELVGTFFLRGKTEGLFDDTVFGFYGTEDGAFTYQTFFGSKTVRALRYYAAKDEFARSPSPDRPGTAKRETNPHRAATPALIGGTLLDAPARR